MLYLAQVKLNEQTAQVELRLLARQTSEYTWAVVNEPEIHLLPHLEETSQLCRESALLGHNYRLILVQRSERGELLTIEDAIPWLLDIIQTYLVKGFSPLFLQQEAERAEQWRQTLTLQNQELGRQRLEIEARREQIQALETELRQERQRLEALQAELKQERQRLEVLSAQLQPPVNSSPPTADL